MGFYVTNDIFADNAWYFRNALVRANYNDVRKGVYETNEFLELFLRNLLLDEKNELHNRSMHISGLLKVDIEAPKVYIEDSKVDIETIKVDIRSNNTNCFSSKTINNIQLLFNEVTYNKIFGRTDVMRILNLKEAGSSKLIKKMLDTGIIKEVSGRGKGKYMFTKNWECD